ncbi:MAG TPA: NADH-quinone oxidoreductase subunit G [Gammaproteobacteria bacterium]|nr:NADH-quinone oxidoreductase subunit G [Gammaproteobacteria bacterium]
MSDNSTFKIEINGVSLDANPGEMVIHVADRNGIKIPRFCYHNKLSIAANCRMCLVEVEKAPKPLPACATPVMDGMKVYTDSILARGAQKGTMEFLLINHPLDCPICDQGGECELQDVAMGYGGDVSHYTEGKRVVFDKNLGPLIATEMTRCIHCTRCVRFGQEIAGLREMGSTGRGEHTLIGTYIEQAITSEMSGNIIDVCPVGALTAKPSRYSARAWELNQHRSIAAHDCVGSNIHVHTFRDQVNRIVPQDNESINECWLSDRDRFSYEGLQHADRLAEPLLFENNAWSTQDWQTALARTAEILQKVVAENGEDQVGILVSPNTTLEEMYLLFRVADHLGISNIDHRLRQADFTDQANAPVSPTLGVSIAELESQNTVLLIGSNICKEQPIIAHRLRKASLKGVSIMSLNMRDYDTHFEQNEKLINSSSGMINDLAAVTRAALELNKQQAPSELSDILANNAPNTQHKAIADTLVSGEQGSVLLGVQAIAHPHYSVLEVLAMLLSETTGANLGYLTDGANTAGACLAGILPHRKTAGDDRSEVGKDAGQMLSESLKAYILFNFEPEHDCWNSEQAIEVLQAAEHVVCFTPYVTETMRAYASVLLPITPYTETSGTFVNIEGKWQSFQGVVSAHAESRPGWRVLRVLGNLLDLPGSDYMSSEQVREELAAHVIDSAAGKPVAERVPVKLFDKSDKGLQRLSGISIYGVDNITRRATALQNTPDARDLAIRINSKLAGKMELRDFDRVFVRQANKRVRMELIIDDGVPDQCVWVPGGTEHSAQLGGLFGDIELEAD